MDYLWNGIQQADDSDGSQRPGGINLSTQFLNGLAMKILFRQSINRGYRGFPTRFLMRLSTLEGGFSEVHQVLTAGVFLTILALSLGAQPWHLGFLAAIPHLTQIFQLIGAYLVEATGERKVIAVLSAAASRLVWLGIPLLYFIDDPSRAILWLLGLLIVASSLELMSGNAWTTWMADLIPRSLRGRYFGYRHGALAAVTITVTLIGGLWLEWGGQRLGMPISLTVILFAAVMAGMVGIVLLVRQPDIRRPKERKAPQVRELLLSPMRNVQFRRALEFFLVWNIAVGFSAAFFNVHMVQQLQMTYITMAGFHSIKPLVAIFLFRWWGKIIDQFQIRSVLMVSGLLVMTLPFMWLFPVKGHIGWLWVIATLSGLGWTGFNLSAYTYPMQLSPTIGRSYYLAYFSIISGLGFVASSILGGAVAQRLTDWELIVGEHTFMAHHFLFVMSGLGRGVALILLLRLKEIHAPGTLALITRIGTGVWRTASLGRPFPRWIRRSPGNAAPTD